MKQWTKPDIALLDLGSTAGGKNSNKGEGINGVDAHGRGNSGFNKNGGNNYVPSEVVVLES